MAAMDFLPAPLYLRILKSSMAIYFGKKYVTLARVRFSWNAVPACGNDQLSAYGGK
jgi:hypothetical protein